MEILSVRNGVSFKVKEVPEFEYNEFRKACIRLLETKDNHIVNYFGIPDNRSIKVFALIARDKESDIAIFSSRLSLGETVESIAQQVIAFHGFEREIWEQFGVDYKGHPWLKPIRFPHDSSHQLALGAYPFFSIDSDELHEVGVGPIHAGVIEPGHFRFICSGEKILHLEIQLGYQHRGIEGLILRNQNILGRTLLAEGIAGDTAIGHSWAFAQAIESLGNIELPYQFDVSRAIALELERMAIHTGDLSAICGDIAYQLGNAVLGRLRTPLINFMQMWCGNRLGKGFVRIGELPYPMTPLLKEQLLKIFEEYKRDFDEIVDRIFTMPSTLSRLERTGHFSLEKAIEIGAVGLSSRASGLERDIRKTHPNRVFKEFINHQPIIKRHGDVFSRTQLRRDEIWQSIDYIKQLLYVLPFGVEVKPIALKNGSLSPDSMVVSLVEGWRGELCHIAITNAIGEIEAYKVKDASFHNWQALALAVRNNEISDFPICNKSFNLSYCGYDL